MREKTVSDLLYRVLEILSDFCKMSISVENLTEPLVLGEGPHWDDRDQALYFVCIHGRFINKYVPSTGVHTKTKLDGMVGFIIPVDGVSQQYVVGVEHKILLIQWDGEEGSQVQILKELAEVDCDSPTTKLNDAKIDPRGRLFAGTMGREDPPGNYENGKGAMYRLDERGLKKMCSGIGISNGLAWSLEEKALYYIDSLEYKIRRYDYDAETGDITNQTYIFDFKKKNLTGIPDGMTIDTDGNLWVAVFGGSCVMKVDPRSGSLLQEVPIPAKQVTSVAFGGPDLDVLFVTSGSVNIDGVQEPPCGATFMVTGLGVKGRSNVNFKLP